MLDEFHIYDHVLSADEILQSVNNTAPQGDNSLLVYLLDKAAKVNTELYKEESIQALQSEVSKAQAVYTNASAAQAEIDAASASLLGRSKGCSGRM